jgi:rhodanese-related sulfurtransferase
MFKYERISTTQLPEILQAQNEKDFLIIDARDKRFYDSTHIKSAININPYSQELSQVLRKYCKKHTIIIYCTFGTRSQIIIDLLIENNYTGQIFKIIDFNEELLS